MNWLKRAIFDSPVQNCLPWEKHNSDVMSCICRVTNNRTGRTDEVEVFTKLTYVPSPDAIFGAHGLAPPNAVAIGFAVNGNTSDLTNDMNMRILSTAIAKCKEIVDAVKPKYLVMTWNQLQTRRGPFYKAILSRTFPNFRTIRMDGGVGLLENDNYQHDEPPPGYPSAI